MLWKEQGVTVLAMAGMYDVFVFNRLKLQQVPALFQKVNRLYPPLENQLFLYACIWFPKLLLCLEEPSDADG